MGYKTALDLKHLRLYFGQQGYSSLRFRSIRHLSSPVEDLEMCKVVGIIDKVRTKSFVMLCVV